jgi:hypothetical protein
MKLTKELLDKIIKEEINNVIAEQRIERNEKYDEAIRKILSDIDDSKKFRLKKGPFSNYFKTIKYPNHPARDLADGYEVHEYSRPDYDEYVIEKERE